jgi:DNA-binding response OmpR family regulator
MKQTSCVETLPSVMSTALWDIEMGASAVGTVLSVSPIEDDHNCLEQIFSEFRWTLQRAHTLPSAMTFLAENHTPVVICERALALGTWKDMMDGSIVSPQPPRVVVTSRLADEHFWADAMHGGAYDVLAKPFETKEVFRIVSLASRSWQDQYFHCTVPKTPLAYDFARHPMKQRNNGGLRVEGGSQY